MWKLLTDPNIIKLGCGFNSDFISLKKYMGWKDEIEVFSKSVIHLEDVITMEEVGKLFTLDEIRFIVDTEAKIKCVFVLHSVV